MQASLATTDPESMDGAIVLKPQGAGRFVAAAFLSLWLCGWFMGESFVVPFLVRCATAVLAGDPNAPSSESASELVPIAGLLFLLVWLTFWTIGGVLAIREVLRHLWGQDRLLLTPADLVHQSVAGPFVRSKRIPRRDIRGVRLLPSGDILAVDTATATRRISQYGTVREREAAVAALRAALGGTLDPVDPDLPRLPEGWQAVFTPEGARVLVSDPRTRARQARVVGVIAFALASAASILVGSALGNLALVPVALVAVIAAAGAGAAAFWLALGRMEWRIGSGRIVQQRRWRGSVREMFIATAIELTTSTDGDGDVWASVDALATPGAAGTAAPSRTYARSSRATRRSISKEMNDDRVPRAIALWLARNADLPLTDDTTPAARAAEIEALRTQLASAGRFGRVAARILDRLAVPNRRS